MKKITAGILAHVDAGKTTLSEAMLYICGSIRRLGRVDHKDAFLDTFSLERERGITIFSKEARLLFNDTQITLIDTPGHTDFSSEAERVLQVLDCAVLVINPFDSVRGHTKTLWKLLEAYGIPTFIFVNKTDLAGFDKERAIEAIQGELSSECIDFSAESRAEIYEKCAMCSENALHEYIETDKLSDETISELISKRLLFPCFFGCALKLSGVEELLDGVRRFSKEPQYKKDFSAKIYKISRDEKGARLTHMKITGGSLKVKSSLYEDFPEEKADQIRIYSGEKYTLADTADPGDICCVTGLTKTYPGEALGGETEEFRPILSPVLKYSVIPEKGVSIHELYKKLSILSEEDPALNISMNSGSGEIEISLLGLVQTEVLKAMVKERFGYTISFGSGKILYKETIKEPCEGVGHFEPLRHYAEVHLLLEPLKRGSGLVFKSDVSEDELEKNYQRLILTHLNEKQHIGVLTGSPITDMKITLKSARAHLKHTEGGDFREATYRAVRQGLMGAESVLLEPFYSFSLEIPPENAGRALKDLQDMGASFSAPELMDEKTVIVGEAPVSLIGDYQSRVISYTKGEGSISLSFSGYRECTRQEEIINTIRYNPESDLQNSPDSVFCAHGAGFSVKWNEVRKYMHLESIMKNKPQTEAVRISAPVSSQAEDKELMKIFENTYGPVKRREFFTKSEISAIDENSDKKLTPEYLENCIIVDGYNVIFSWDELKRLAKDNLDAARQALINILSNYQGFKKCGLILVFDAYKVQGGTGESEKHGGMFVIYTKEAQSADMYIEKTTYESGKKYRITVVTSDNLEETLITSHGAMHISSKAFEDEVKNTNREIRDIIENLK